MLIHSWHSSIRGHCSMPNRPPETGHYCTKSHTRNGPQLLHNESRCTYISIWGRSIREIGIFIADSALASFAHDWLDHPRPSRCTLRSIWKDYALNNNAHRTQRRLISVRSLSWAVATKYQAPRPQVYFSAYFRVSCLMSCLITINSKASGTLAYAQLRYHRLAGVHSLYSQKVMSTLIKRQTWHSRH